MFDLAIFQAGKKKEYCCLTWEWQYTECRICRTFGKVSNKNFLHELSGITFTQKKFLYINNKPIQTIAIQDTWLAVK